MGLLELGFRLWFSRNFLPPRFLLKPIGGVRLLGMPLIGDLIFFLGSLCPFHICPTKQYDEWRTRRWCERCQDWGDMG